MGILSSMYTGFTGIQGQGEALAVYGDNISNAATTGFKVARPEFKDAVAKSLNGMGSSMATGRGTKLGNVRTVFSQGTLTQTESPTDLAITGNGFFALDGVEGRSYTRDGSFHFDKEGKLVNSTGEKVLGFQADESGKITSKMGALSIDRAIIDARGTKNVQLFANLDSRADASIKFDPKNPDKTSHFATGVTVHDTNGAAHAVTVYFNKVDGQNWEWKAMAKGEEIEGGKPGELIQQASGKLTFNEEGKLAEQSIDSSEWNFNKGSKQGQKIDFSFGKDIKAGGDGLQVTQYGANAEAYKTIQDGYSSGSIGSLKFDDNGCLVAMYTNGEQVTVGQVALAKFESPEDLMKTGGNKYKETRTSGQPTIGSPLSGGRGQISSKSLEASATDIANEFINLMQSQRNFQANSKVISVGDELLGEVINLKRT
ncbi:MAG: flagellar hook protein FlgE [Bdellovibrionales bacterium]|nr:flagellar hook protein FlgE [Bdellovibrionales bacterium]